MNIGLILEGGGMRGAFTAGVLDVFLEHPELRFTSCIGVSAGACHACSFVAGQKGRAFAVSSDYLNDWHYCSLRSLLLTGDLFGADFLYRKIPEELYPIDNQAFLKKGIRFYAVVTNCRTGKAEYMPVRDLIKDISAVQASSSLPIVSRMVAIGNEYYLDGGIADAIPVEQSIRMGNSKNVVILTQPRDYRKEKNKALPLIRIQYAKYPRLVEAMEKRHLEYNRVLTLLESEEAAGRALVIAPKEKLPIKRVERSKDKLLVAYNLGRCAAEEKLPQLKRFLKEPVFR